MKLLGAEVRPVVSGSRTLKDAMNEAMRDWVTNVDDTFYLIGSVAGPHPYPVRWCASSRAVIGHEAHRSSAASSIGRIARCVLIACVGGGSNAIGLFHAVRR
jgi:tryptophan synthase beta chain